MALGLFALALPVLSLLPGIEEHNAIPVYSITLGDGVYGRFVLGTGPIESTVHYHFYVQDGSYFRLRSVKASNVLVELSDDEQPTYIERKIIPQHIVQKVLL